MDAVRSIVGGAPLAPERLAGATTAYVGFLREGLPCSCGARVHQERDEFVPAADVEFSSRSGKTRAVAAPAGKVAAPLLACPSCRGCYCAACGLQLQRPGEVAAAAAGGSSAAERKRRKGADGLAGAPAAAAAAALPAALPHATGCSLRYAHAVALGVERLRRVARGIDAGLARNVATARDVLLAAAVAYKHETMPGLIEAGTYLPPSLPALQVQLLSLLPHGSVAGDAAARGATRSKAGQVLDALASGNRAKLPPECPLARYGYDHDPYGYGSGGGVAGASYGGSANDSMWLTAVEAYRTVQTEARQAALLPALVALTAALPPDVCGPRGKPVPRVAVAGASGTGGATVAVPDPATPTDGASDHPLLLQLLLGLGFGDGAAVSGTAASSSGGSSSSSPPKSAAAAAVAGDGVNGASVWHATMAELLQASLMDVGAMPSAYADKATVAAGVAAAEVRRQLFGEALRCAAVLAGHPDLCASLLYTPQQAQERRQAAAKAGAAAVSSSSSSAAAAAPAVAFVPWAPPSSLFTTEPAAGKPSPADTPSAGGEASAASTAPARGGGRGRGRGRGRAAATASAPTGRGRKRDASAISASPVADAPQAGPAAVTPLSQQPAAASAGIYRLTSPLPSAAVLALLLGLRKQADVYLASTTAAAAAAGTTTAAAGGGRGPKAPMAHTSADVTRLNALAREIKATAATVTERLRGGLVHRLGAQAAAAHDKGAAPAASPATVAAASPALAAAAVTAVSATVARAAESAAAWLSAASSIGSGGGGQTSSSSTSAAPDADAVLLADAEAALQKLSALARARATHVGWLDPIHMAGKRGLGRISGFAPSPDAEVAPYEACLKDLAFEVVPDLVPAYTRVAGGAGAGSTAAAAGRRLIRVSTELAQLPSLAVHWGSSILCRQDEASMDRLRAVIVGPADTPYMNALFAFDVTLPADYPNSPPKVQSLTTGGGSVRFNPNLYADGKVCLSLLGTWSGPGWVPGTSTLSQVLLSIQGQILVGEPYANEPGYESIGLNSSESSQATNFWYNAPLRLGALRFGMVDALKSPLPGFADAARAHFYYKRAELRAQVTQWLGELAAAVRHELRLRCAGAAAAAALELTVQAEVRAGTAKVAPATAYFVGLTSDRASGLSPRALALRTLLAEARNVASSWNASVGYTGGGAVPPVLAHQAATQKAAAAAAAPPVRTVAWTRNATALQAAASVYAYPSSSSSSAAAGGPARLLPPPAVADGDGAAGPNPVTKALDAILPLSLEEACAAAPLAGVTGQARVLAAGAAFMSAADTLLPRQPSVGGRKLEPSAMVFSDVSSMLRDPASRASAAALFVLAGEHIVIGAQPAAAASAAPSAAAAAAGKGAGAASSASKATKKGGRTSASAAGAGAASSAAAAAPASAAAATAALEVTLRYDPPSQLAALFAEAVATLSTAGTAAASSSSSSSSAAAGSGPCTALMHRLLDPLRQTHAGAVQVLTSYGVSPDAAPGILSLASSAPTLLLAFNTASAADELFRLLAGLAPPAPPSGDDDEGL